MQICRSVILGLYCFFSLPLWAASAGTLSDVPVFDQSGKDRLFFQDVIGGKKAIVAFSYAHCTKICPMIGQKLQSLQKALGDRLGKEVVLVTLTIDPERDDKTSLKNWSESLQAKSGWSFVGGERPNLDLISERIFGAKLIGKDEHSPFLVVKGADGEWIRMYGLSMNKEILDKLETPKK